MSFLTSLNRQMERNQAASRALLEYYDQSSIRDMDHFDKELWSSIAASNNENFSLEIKIDDEVSLDFLIKLFVKIGFSCEDSVRLMMQLHKKGSLVLAKAEENVLLRLQDYINTQARGHAFKLESRIIQT